MSIDPSQLRFAIFGKIIYTEHFIKELNRLGFLTPILFTSLDIEYKRDKRLLDKYDLFFDSKKLEEEGLVKVYKIKNINSPQVLSILEENRCNIALSTSCRNIIKKNLIEFFDYKIFNIHDSFLPNERGGALNTWRILNGINSVGNTIHYLDEGIDSGDIVIQNNINIDKDYPKPIDYLISENKNCEILLTKFIHMLLKSNKIPSKKQIHNDSLYYPRLYTEINGAINWDWNVLHIERFIRAFSEPYPGAFTTFRGKKIHINQAYIDTSIQNQFHPYSNGKVLTVLDNNEVRIVAGGKPMIIKKITVEGNLIKPGEFLTTRYTLITKKEDLDVARDHTPTTLEMNKNES